MRRQGPTDPSSRHGVLRRAFHLAVPLVLATVAVFVFHGGLQAPFIFDDLDSIVDNPSIRSLWPPSRVLVPPLSANAVAGRPFSNLSLALSYAAGGLNVRAYHVFSLAVHVANGLLLLGILRRTLTRRAPALAEAGIPAAVTLLWLVHPLQTEPVIYAIQRTELMVSGFYLATLYAAIRAWEPEHRRVWRLLAVAACGLGMATKEIMVTAPLLIVLYDRAFVTGSFGEAFRRRRGLYAGLAGTWSILIALLSTGAQARVAGPVGRLDLSVQYLLIQGQVVLHYLHLALWPDSLSIVYDWPVRGSLSQHGAYAVMTGILALLALFALWRNSWLGFLGAWFFLILAPTSSLLPLPTEVVAERRMYLPLAAVLTIALVGVYAGLRRVSPRAGRALAGALVLSAGVALSVRSVARVRDYSSDLSIWSAAAREAPGSSSAHGNLGKALLDRGRLPEAEAELRRAIMIAPARPAPYQYLGILLTRTGDWDQAEQMLRESVRLAPDDMRLVFTLAGFLGRHGAVTEAESLYREVIAHQEGDWRAQAELGRLILRAGRHEEARGPLQRALLFAPREPAVRESLALALAEAGLLSDAERELTTLTERWPQDPVLQNDLGTVLVRAERPHEGIDCFERALRLRPTYGVARYNLASALAAQGRSGEALLQYRTVLSGSDASEAMRTRAEDKILALEGASGTSARIDGPALP